MAADTCAVVDDKSKVHMRPLLFIAQSPISSIDAEESFCFFMYLPFCACWQWMIEGKHVGFDDMLGRYLAFKDLKGYRASWLRHDLAAGLSITFLALPQGMAYALVAGLPPVVGLYAAAIPVVICSLLRSSRYVVGGPTNALSLIVALAVGMAAAQGWDPLATACTLALLVGMMQIFAGALRLGALVDYISGPVVLGYISGAALLIACGQLPYVTGTSVGSGPLWLKLSEWGTSLPEANLFSVLLALGTASLIALLRLSAKLKRLPLSLLALLLGLGVSEVFGLREQGVQTIADLGALTGGLPTFALPSLQHIPDLLALAFAATVLSLVESTSVARSIGSAKGDKLDASVEFVGQGWGNIAAAFFAGYPISGSPSRTAMNAQSSGKSRLAGAFSGVFVLLLVLMGSAVFNVMPIACFAGMLLVLSYDLISFSKIRFVLRGHIADRLAFIATLLGALVMSLDKAIYLGVLISIVHFLRRARILRVEELGVGPDGKLLETHLLGEAYGTFKTCPQIKIIHLEGSLFFAAAGELETFLSGLVANKEVEVVVLRLNRTQGLDLTVIQVLVDVIEKLRKDGRTLLLAGVRLPGLSRLEKTGAIDVIGRENVFPFRPRFFADMSDAIERALGECSSHQCDVCPLSVFADKGQ